MFTLKFIKQHFPIFNIKQSENKYFIYLDSAATSHKPKIVIDSLSIFFKKYYSNINRGLYKISGVSNSIYEKARSLTSTFVGSLSSKNIVFTENSTSSLNTVQRSFMLEKKLFQKKKRIMLSVYEHHSNIIPWKILSLNTGSKLVYVGTTSTGFINFKCFVAKLDRRTFLASLSSCSNTLGLLNKLKKITSLLAKINVISVIDGSQEVLHGKVSVRSLNCDFYTFSGHKMMSPCGIGVLYIKNKWLGYVMPTKLGGGVTFNLKLNQKVVLKTPPYVFEGGTPNINGACGLLASINYLNFLGYKPLRLQTIKMHFFFKKSILNVYVKDLVFIPKLSSNYLFHKNPVFLFINNKHSHDVSHHLNLFNLAIRSGFQCNQPLIEGGLKTHTVSRASYCMYNCFRCIRGFILNLKRNNF